MIAMIIKTLKRYFSRGWPLPFLIGVCAFLFIFFSNPTVTAFWRLRTYAANCIAVCLLAHVIIVLLLFMCKCWKPGIAALCVLPIFAFGAFIAAMSIGPDLEDITEKVSKTTSIPTSKLKCIGGRLARESTIIFETNYAPINTDGADLVNDDSAILRIEHTTANFNVPLSGHFKAWRFPLDYDQIIAVKDDTKWLLIFFGMSNM